MLNLGGDVTITGSAPRRLIRRESLTEQTARAIREAILNGTYALGQKLPEGELVARFAVSSSVIREALHVLQGEGIIVTKPYCGRSVFHLPPNEAPELIAARAALESYTAYLAAKKITSESGKKILAGAARMISDPPDNYTDWADQELGFHRAVWEASQNEWLAQQLVQFSLPLFVFQIVGLSQGYSDVHETWKNRGLETPDNPWGHQLLARAIVSGDAKKAKEMMVEHILHGPLGDLAEVFRL